MMPSRSTTSAGFSLIEMLVATVVSAILMGGVLAVLAGIARDRKKLVVMQTLASPIAVLDRIQWDLTNAQTLLAAKAQNAVVLVGHGAIDPGTLAPNGRFCRVTYRIYFTDKVGHLVREQQYLDDAISPSPWRELLAVDASQLWVEPQVAAEPPGPPGVPGSGPSSDGSVRVPERVRVHLGLSSQSIDRELWVR